MRRFLLNIITICLAAIAILCVITWAGVRKIDTVSYRLPQETHAIFMGPSTMEGSINDTLIPGVQNLSRSGTFLPYLVPLLPQILDENPQIDTVYINHGRFIFMPLPNVAGFQKMQSLRDKLPFIWKKRQIMEWGDLLQQTDFYAAVLNPRVREVFSRKSSILDYELRFYADITHNLYNNSADWSVAWYDSITCLHGGNVYTKDELLEKSALAEKYSRMAIDICKSHGVVPVLFFTPLYHYETWFPYEPFCELMEDYDQEILVADYENFEFSNDSLCRQDIHHLNIYGATEFSNYLAKNGIYVVKLGDWLSSRCSL